VCSLAVMVFVLCGILGRVHGAAQVVCDGNLDVIRYLISRGADVNAEDSVRMFDRV
jgi:hypothetical protein